MHTDLPRSAPIQPKMGQTLPTILTSLATTFGKETWQQNVVKHIWQQNLETFLGKISFRPSARRWRALATPAGQARNLFPGVEYVYTYIQCNIHAYTYIQRILK